MKGKIVPAIMLTLLLASMLALAFNIQPVRASGTVYIRADGSIDPPTAPISSIDNVTYTFAANINDSIVVERDNAVLDGAGYTVQGTGAYLSKGIYLSGVFNVTIKNASIIGFWYGVCLNSTSDNDLQENNIRTNAYYGIGLFSSSNNSITGNNITNNWPGIELYNSSNNSIAGNTITNNSWSGIDLYSSSNNNSIVGNNITANNNGISHSSSSNNSIAGNSITNNGNQGIHLEESPNNKFFHNNFVNNNIQVYSSDSANIWDDGYPSGGNYWSDYVGADLYKGPYQNETGNDGMGDTSYVINADNQDRFPLMHPWSPLPVRNMNTGLGYATIQEAINAASEGDTIFVKPGTYYENVIINKKVSLVGEDRGTTIIDGSGNGNVVCMTSAAGTANISSFTLRNGRGINDGAGIDVQSSSNHTITGNIITDNQRGLRLQFSRYNVICDNEITSNIETGIELRSSHWNSIFRNTASGNGLNIWIIGSSVNSIAGNEVADGDWGICLTESFNNTLRYNNMNQNWFNFAVQGARVQDYIHDIDFSNFVNGKAVYYMVGKKNLVIDASVYPEVGYIGIVNCENMTVKNLNLEANAEGIKLVNTTGSLITNLRINGVSAGISIEFGSCNNTVSKNVVLWCEMVGIYLHGSSCYNVIYENQVACLNSGIRTLDSSDNNLVYHNTFFQYFPQQMSFGSTNTWDNGYPSGGNYWSDYNGSDLYLGEFQTEPGSDGIGDTPYTIDGNNLDNYPLMNPWTPPDAVALNITTSKRFIGEGYSAYLTALVENQGGKVENLNTTVYVGEANVTFQTFLLKSQNSLIHTFSWDSTGFSKGNYTLSTYVEPIEGEEDLADNTMYNDWVFITIPGDVNGDSSVNVLDAIVLSNAIFSEPSEPNWNANADITNDGKVNILDCVILANHFNQRWT